ncbi:MAG: UDP-3-O-acyl-N-acetylglucosamine deacetylase [Deltaproteobacteria bacterium]|jgi:UDP-3-O-[3-hydroxymyristoyl] N-acetylglucosamine deacetylase|nr:UDP-3-O-acyl-N-acetylglucosamine deacetylase [Deltaproteobacteria bacterium]
MFRFQKTVCQPLKLSGVGLHTGKTIDVAIYPLPVNSGVWFQRTDTPGAPALLATSENVTDTSLATTIGHGDAAISTLEHFLATVGGLGISNLKVEVNGPELPILDGSAAPWASLLRKAGVKTLNSPRAFYSLKKAFTLTEGDKILKVEPSDRFSVEATIEFPGFVKPQRLFFKFSEAGFVSEICPSRTFCLLKDVELMKSHNRALGGGLDNAVVIDNDGQILNPDGLRFPDELVRHKILDFIGDLTLAQYPILGHFTTHKTGHTLNQKFLRALLSAPALLEKHEPTPQSEPQSFDLPLPSVAAVALAS